LTAFCLFALVQAGPIDRWGGVKEGSWVQAHISHQLGDKKQEIDTTRTVKQVRDDEIVLDIDNAPGKKGLAFRMRRDLLSALGTSGSVIVEEKTLDPEDLVVGPATYKCGVHEFRWRATKDTKLVNTLKLWECDQAPGRLVQAEGLHHDQGKGWKFAGKLTSLEAKVKVGTRELPCALFESGATGPGSWTDRVWISKDVPGMIVRSLGQREVSGTKETTEWSVTDYEIKK
jgi:hypothetical protein